MPELSRFRGIVVFMNYNDHDPPHFHARFGEQEVTIEIETGVVQGRMSAAGLRLLLEWMNLHQEELRVNWVRGRERRRFQKIDPLP